jgi:hypothetical protein
LRLFETTIPRPQLYRQWECVDSWSREKLGSRKIRKGSSEEVKNTAVESDKNNLGSCRRSEYGRQRLNILRNKKCGISTAGPQCVRAWHTAAGCNLATAQSRVPRPNLRSYFSLEAVSYPYKFTLPIFTFMLHRYHIIILQPLTAISMSFENILHWCRVIYGSKCLYFLLLESCGTVINTLLLHIREVRDKTSVWTPSLITEVLSLFSPVVCCFFQESTLN